MKRRHPVSYQVRAALLALSLAALLPACQAMQEVGKVYLRTTPEGRELLERWEHYESIAERLQGYHDDGQLDAGEVLEVLQDAGVIEPPPTAGTGGGEQPSPPTTPPQPADGKWAWPMKAGVISSEYGRRGSASHEGIDIAADPGEPIYAASSGSVIYSDNGMSGFGNAIILRHDDRTTTLYAHATTLIARKGATVERGTRIATVGSTGRSTGPHLHFEVRVGETPLDPRDVLPRQPF